MKGKFDHSLITIFKKLFNAALGSEYKNEEIINKLIELEVIRDKGDLKKFIDNVGQSNEPRTLFNGVTTNQLQKAKTAGSIKLFLPEVVLFQLEEGR